ncbi:exodeoxyribonuclease V subunit gamma [Gallaecimonas kandeliae]|uniref:exodeoxyribonuclease V subunit gamma n=1 Tax=Gallaecimonas kandeliae TaxID=3029055 RepID=UPI002647895D|nr:exodeoxyribonuclease V subunit gamma [Gallaecimonas kandeliae]WKE66224.1 exodeoxyribonuclease V subunit gamma [Gallaecimonas kandeliae]
MQGLSVIHANKLEDLRDLLLQFLKANPLPVLENETFLVQSNGMAQWLKLALAHDEGLGVCAAVDMQMPGRFLWQAYRAVLGADAVPPSSAYDKPRLRWRLLRLLPGLLADPDFAPLRRFLAEDDDCRKRWQLAEKLADLFDQYQVYRADWLNAWARGEDVILGARGQARPLDADQRWQAKLWRTLEADLPAQLRSTSRAGLHQGFLDACAALTERPAALPRRVLVFGISSLPKQVLEMLSAISRHCQVLLLVNNPCRHYWGDIIDGRELLRIERRRHQDKPGLPMGEALHSQTNPLLASWGKQGRDYIGLLYQYDEPESYQDNFQKIDLFDDYQGRHLLAQLQQDILDLEPLPVAPRSLADDDRSLQFHVAHSRQRELEVLHDQLLALFEAYQARGEPLRPRDVIVMVPDIAQYAPHVEAVFGQLDRRDPRFIPYTLSDRTERSFNPMLLALEKLMELPRWRFGVSEILDLLDVPAVRARFDLAESQLPLLRQWVEGAGVRWGLSGEQRAALALPAWEENGWLFGLKRMLLGYAVGDSAPLAGIEPYDEVAGLDAALVGSLSDLLAVLQRHWQALAEPAPVADWCQRLKALLADCFVPQSDQDRHTHARLLELLEDWQADCDQAGLTEALPLNVVREAWLAGLDDSGLSQRFLAGAVNFATLMPMRAIPFKVVCLLGLNDGDYPRSQQPVDFDLMHLPGQYRPGDRSRREDDRYLFLEALLSARDCLYLSWLGRSEQDNTERPPSVLLGQLRDHVQAGWQHPEGVLARLTQEHPLQPFSRRYFDGSGPFTYAAEWRAQLEAQAAEGQERLAAQALTTQALTEPLTLKALGAFLRQPVRLFFNERLKIWFEDMDQGHGDEEPFALDGLARYQLMDELLAEALDAGQEAIGTTLARQRRRGQLPAAAFAELAMEALAEPAAEAHGNASALLARFDQAVPALELDLELGDGLKLEDWQGELRKDNSGRLAQLLLRPGELAPKGKVKYHHLVRPWVRHLALCAAGHPVTTLVSGADTVLNIQPLAQGLALGHLQALAKAYQDGLNAPLPLPQAAAFAFLEALPKGEEEALTKAAARYDGSDFQAGEKGQDPYLTRAFPTFAQLDQGAFQALARALYQPLFDAMEAQQ